MMVELIQLVDEALARHGLGPLLPTGQEFCYRPSLEPSLGSRLLAESAENKDLSVPNWASAPGETRQGSHKCSAGAASRG